MLSTRKNDICMGKTISLPIGLWNMILEEADAKSEQYSNTVARMLRLGFCKQKEMIAQSEIIEQQKVDELLSAKVSS